MVAPQINKCDRHRHRRQLQSPGTPTPATKLLTFPAVSLIAMCQVQDRVL